MERRSFFGALAALFAAPKALEALATPEPVVRQGLPSLKARTLNATPRVELVEIGIGECPWKVWQAEVDGHQYLFDSDLAYLNAAGHGMSVKDWVRGEAMLLHADRV